MPAADSPGTIPGMQQEWKERLGDCLGAPLALASTLTLFVPIQMYGLNPGEEKVIDTVFTPRGEFPLSLSVEPEVVEFNLPYSPAWLLFIASTDENVDVTTLELPPLPGPLADRSRFIGAGFSEEDANASDWITRLVELNIMLPR